MEQFTVETALKSTKGWVAIRRGNGKMQSYSITRIERESSSLNSKKNTNISSDSISVILPGHLPENTSTCQVKHFELNVGDIHNPFLVNAYVVFNAQSKNSVIIDPGDGDSRIESFISDNQLTITGILNTHGHWDHIKANGHYCKLYNTTIVGHIKDKHLYGMEPEENTPRTWLTDTTQTIIGAGFPINFLHTPGHTPGSGCFLIGDYLFSGDTLFKESIGRTFGSPEKQFADQHLMVTHIQTKLMGLSPNTLVFPGHGPESTISHEIHHNPFLAANIL